VGKCRPTRNIVSVDEIERTAITEQSNPLKRRADFFLWVDEVQITSAHRPPVHLEAKAQTIEGERTAA